MKITSSTTKNKQGIPEEMYHTLKNIKTSLSSDTIILPGHNYSIKKTSRLKEEIDGNPFMSFNDMNRFIDYRMTLHDKVRQSPYSPVITDLTILLPLLIY